MQYADVVFNANIGLGSILTFLASVFGFLTVWLQTRKVHSKVEEINNAVNGVGPDQKPMVQNVQDLHDQLTTHTHDRRTGDETPPPDRATL